MKITEELKNDMTGVALLADWLGDTGEPVHEMVANFRAERCMSGNNGKPCEQNVAPNWWDKAKSTIAAWIRGELELKNGMNLKVPGEENLNMCRCCGCCLKLKVWTPTAYLRKHIDIKSLDKAPRWCWMRKELL